MIPSKVICINYLKILILFYVRKLISYYRTKVEKSTFECEGTFEGIFSPSAHNGTVRRANDSIWAVVDSTK